MLRHPVILLLTVVFYTVSGLSVLQAGKEVQQPAFEKAAGKEQSFVFDGKIDEHEYKEAKKIEFKIWNKQTAAAYFLNSGGYLIIALDVPERCLPESTVGIYLDTRANGGMGPGADDMAFKFYPEAVKHSRFEQLKGSPCGEWNGMGAAGWAARAYLRMIERWQCEFVFDLDALNVKYGGGSVVNAAIRLIGGKGTNLADYPENTNTSDPATWTLKLPLPAKEIPGIKIKIDPVEVTGLQEQERRAAKAFDEFHEKLMEMQNGQVARITGIRKKLEDIRNVRMKALRKGDTEKAAQELREYMKAMRGQIDIFMERARACEKLLDEIDRVIGIIGSERAELYDYKAAILMNLFDSDPSSYTTERGAKCSEYLMRAFDINPNIVHIVKIRDLMKYGCIREAAPLIKARLELEPDNTEVRLLSAICSLRMGGFKEAREDLKKVLAEQGEDRKLKPEVNRHIGWITAAEKLYKAEQKKLGEDAIKNDLPRVELDTTRGKIVVELFEDDAPNTVKNFVSLVEKGFYNGVVFHRVESWVVQTGDPEGCGIGGPGYIIRSEPNGRKHFAGYIGMARGAPNSEGSQFYFVRYYSPFLDDAKFAVFGRIIEGMDVLDKMERKDSINRAVVLRKREDTVYVPLKNE